MKPKAQSKMDRQGHGNFTEFGYSTFVLLWTLEFLLIS